MSIRMSLTQRCLRACVGLIVLTGLANHHLSRPLCAQQPDNKTQKEATDSALEQKGPASSRRAIGYYSEAAGFQNKGAYKLAIEQWKKLLDEFPEDPLASKGWHYMGICYTQLEDPNYAEAATAFGHALGDEALEVREESMINLAWCLFSQGRATQPSSPEYRQGLEKARERLSEFLKSYSTGSYVDQAYFYMGEIEYSLGDIDKSIPYYQKLLDTPSLQKSNLRSGGLYAIAVAYEEAKQDDNATKRFRQFLKENPQHALAGEVSVRLADLLLKQGKTDEAAKLLASVVQGEAGKMSDYARLRLGYAASTQGKNEEAAEHYTELLKQFPNSKHAPTAALSLGQCLYKSGQYDQALEKFSQVLPAKDAQAAEAAHWMAITLQRQNRSPEALKVAQAALEWEVDTPNKVNLLMDYADALYADPESLDKAREAYEKIVN
ncbi:MAG: tetratricopeptide repeat protein, partial [Aureliella sp.]